MTAAFKHSQHSSEDYLSFPCVPNLLPHRPNPKITIGNDCLKKIFKLPYITIYKEQFLSKLFGFQKKKKLQISN